MNTEAKPKPVLKYTKTMSFKVDYGDLEKFIKEITGKQISVPAILECGNDSDHDFDIGDHPEWVDDEDMKMATAFLRGDAKSIPTYHLGTLLEVMCMEKLIEPGNYTISVSW